MSRLKDLVRGERFEDMDRQRSRRQICFLMSSVGSPWLSIRYGSGTSLEDQGGEGQTNGRNGGETNV